MLSAGLHRLLGAEILAGQLAGIRIEPATLMFYDPATRVLLRTRPSPLAPAGMAWLRGARTARPVEPGTAPQADCTAAAPRVRPRRARTS